MKPTHRITASSILCLLFKVRWHGGMGTQFDVNQRQSESDSLQPRRGVLCFRQPTECLARRSTTLNHGIPPLRLFGGRSCSSGRQQIVGRAGSIDNATMPPLSHSLQLLAAFANAGTKQALFGLNGFLRRTGPHCPELPDGQAPRVLIGKTLDVLRSTDKNFDESMIQP